ncbi:prolyl oligopeptidase family serine peptidase [Chitinophaga horti]|uniref:Prolyl oligopeptidase family serine peptidase n=1 Tax=Chitinophaga horti TaxID=2920382 RepID=A0ABY6IVV9_9BACT|nr:prolyl oligopeptidase family serine peptidase [Chitinophaga horti]UYQ91512.1 prolyl oligopeptidase family serine peptidase [Chitinophaga horti]
MIRPKSILPLLLLPVCAQLKAQQLTVEKIMRDPKWIGTSPSGLFWSSDSKNLYFSWNPDKALSDSLYYISTTDRTPRKTLADARSNIQTLAGGSWNKARTLFLYNQSGDLYLQDVKSGKTTRITHTAAYESGAQFGFNDTRIVYRNGSDLFSWDLKSGATEQLTRFMQGNKPESGSEKGSAADKWLKVQQLELIDVLKSRKEKRDAAEAFQKTLTKEETLRALYLEGKSLGQARISEDGQLVVYTLYKSGSNTSTNVPDYVTESGYTTDIPARSKVGTEGQGASELYLYDRKRDTVYTVKTDVIPGLTDKPDYRQNDTAKKAVKRDFRIGGLQWSPNNKYALIDVRSNDSKDRWLLVLDAANGQLKPLDRQRNEAWINYSLTGDQGWLNDHTVWYQSEATGYAHLYTQDILTGAKRQLTTGNYEVQQISLSSDKKYFYLHTNETHPGVVKFYRLPVNGGKAEVLTSLEGGIEAELSPDEKWIAFRHSASNQPWELYLQENKPGAKAVQITDQAQSAEFKTYAWRMPEVITFAARDGANVYARIYKPEAAKKNGAAVVFVHGAGYLQNAHKWWSSYFREYMFHNLLTDMGFTVLDMDYRGSAGYGADWRTGIYRHMGGKDLTDHVDGAHYLAKEHGIDPKRIGIYGGSYGGFITLMAMFTTPDEFKAGAALRSVTDWAHYNHGYTSNILNTPVEDSIAFTRSSPIYFAEGLKGHLLMCHGVVDTNVHFQDIIRLSQRLIELGKDNWELAVYPVEDHGFVEPSSWTDEYKRILKLFTSTLTGK